MIVTILSISLALFWLLVETDYLRVCLTGFSYELGSSCPWRLPDNLVTDEMRQALINRWNCAKGLTKIQLAMYEQGLLEPLFGWGYAYQFQDFQPEYKIELIGEHHKFTFKTQDTNVLRDCFRVYRNPYLKVKMA